MDAETIRQDIRTQRRYEGNTPESALLLKLLDQLVHVKGVTASDWRTLTRCRFQPYGKLSFEKHRFWYPSPILVELEQFFTDGDQL